MLTQASSSIPISSPDKRIRNKESVNVARKTDPERIWHFDFPKKWLGTSNMEKKKIHGKSLTWFNDKVTLFPIYNACIFALLFCFNSRMYSSSFICAWRGLLSRGAFPRLTLVLTLVSVTFCRTLHSWNNKSEWFYQKYSKYVPFVLRRLSKCARNPICASCLRKTLFERELWSLQTKPATKVVTYKNKC